MNVKECSLVIFLTALTMIGGGCLFFADRLLPKESVKTILPPAPSEPKKIYRIVVENGLNERQSPDTYTPQEQQAVDEMKAVLSRWPRMMWLASVDGRLIVVKMGMNGKPIGRVSE